jgi:hypothetical protein
VTPCSIYTVHKETRGMGFLVEPQNQSHRVSQFGPQNQAGFGLLVAPQNRRREVGARHASRSSGLLYMEASWARVS